MKPYLELIDIFHERSLDRRMIDLASIFKAYRKEAELTQVQLSDRNGVPYGTIERTGKISMDSLWMLSLAIGCDDQLDRLFGAPPLTTDRLRG